MRLELELPAAPESIPIARHAIARHATTLGLELDDDVRERIAITVTEACTNCVQHAYPEAERPTATYMLEADIHDDTLVVIVNDCGVGARAGATSANAGPGFGLALIKELADASEFVTRPGYGTRVVLRFAIGRTPARA